MFKKFIDALSDIQTVRKMGKISKVVGLTLESTGPDCFIGEMCKIYSDKFKREDYILAEVVGFKDAKVILMPFGNIEGIAPGNVVEATGKPLSVKLSPQMVGMVLSGLGEPLEGEFIQYEEERSVYQSPPDPMKRKIISEKLLTGVKAIDLCMTIGKGQRVGIFAGSGVGKSTLLGMMARDSEADINVIALIGERGREVREFIERDLGEEGLKKSIVIVATSADPPLIRLKGALVATTIAEYFRDMGKNVLFMMDSVTRFALAQREIGLAVGEPPTTRGFTPSVFTLLPMLLERTGPAEIGTITAFYSVLVEGDDMDEPIADAVRGILDGHIVLSRDLAHHNHYPAIDILQSVSRLMPHITTSQHQEYSNKVREIWLTYKQAEDLINIGAYTKGNNPAIDYAISKIDFIRKVLKQGIKDKISFPGVIQELAEKL